MCLSTNVKLLFVKIYYKTVKLYTCIINKGWHLAIIYLTVSICGNAIAASTQCWWMVQASRSHSRCRLVVSSDEMSTCAAGVPLVHKLLLWLTVGWSWLANRAVRSESSSCLLSNVKSLTTKHGWTYQKAEFVDKHFSPQYNRFSCFLLQVPQTFN